MLSTVNAMYSNEESAPSKDKAAESGTQPEHSGNLLELIKEVADNTGCQGVPNIKRARSLVKKLFWLLIVIAGVAMMIWKITEAVNKYYSYPIDTKVNYMYASKLSFPAVTVCNLNPIRESAMDYCGAGMRNLVAAQDPGDTSMTSDQRGNMSFQDWDTEEAAEDFYQEDTSYQAKESLISYWSQLDPWYKWKIGHNLTMMLMSCTFAGMKCSPRNFTQFTNYMYGNCFTFNANGWSTEKGTYVSKVGPMYGLTMELYVEQEEYLAMTDSAGFRVVIHNQTYMPFPEDDGFSVSPGIKSTVSIKRTEITRPIPPYGNCQQFSNESNREVSGFVNELPQILYTTGACKKTCYQKSLLERCGCFDSKYPFNTNLTVYDGIASNVTDASPCEHNDTGGVDSCETIVSTMFAANDLGCSDMCPTECFHVRYGYTVSSSRYPATEALGGCLQKIQKLSGDLFDKIMEMEDDDDRRTFAEQNVVKMDIFYEDMNYETIITESSYGSMEFFSDLGGQTGLWLGLSIIALFELVELICDIICLICRQMTRKGKVNNRDADEEDNGNATEKGEKPKLDDNQGVHVPDNSKYLSNTVKKPIFAWR